ncbi:MAG: copper resistance protein CopZ [Candidatus Cloacimonadota bacterium]|nr:MAG: copper resistance protein CopZ [Candidatus Cloacimonadota bacterium]PIE79231.1 MAG: copper resistance protein CopZ [Candidatus Delongbacteria bacterium]
MIIKFKVGGMSCNHCSESIKSGFLSVDTIDSVDVDLNTKEVILDGVIDKDKIKEIVEDLGFDYLG